MALREDELAGLCDDVDLERDRALVERCQAGDSAAFGNLYARYYERLLRFCMRRLSDRHEAEDAAQEAFARAWKALPRFAGDKRFYPWLTVIAGNICTDMLRRRSRSTPTDDMELTAQQPLGAVADDTSEDLVLAAVDGELVNRALDRLSVRHRHVLAMREGSGWTYQQIADHEGVEIGTIETLLVAGPPSTQARVRRSIRVEGRAGRLPGGQRRTVPPGLLPGGPPRRHRAAAGRRHVGRHGLAQRAGRSRRGGCRGGSGVHCAPRAQGQRHQCGGGRRRAEASALAAPAARTGPGNEFRIRVRVERSRSTGDGRRRCRRWFAAARRLEFDLVRRLRRSRLVAGARRAAWPVAWVA